MKIIKSSILAVGMLSAIHANAFVGTLPYMIQCTKEESCKNVPPPLQMEFQVPINSDRYILNSVIYVTSDPGVIGMTANYVDIKNHNIYINFINVSGNMQPDFSGSSWTQTTSFSWMCTNMQSCPFIINYGTAQTKNP
jgi:hypothetical protein